MAGLAHHKSLITPRLLHLISLGGHLKSSGLFGFRAKFFSTAEYIESQMLLDTFHSETQICGSTGLISHHWYAVGRKETPQLPPQLSSTKLESLPPMLSQRLSKLPTPFLPSLFTFKPAPTHFQGILLKLKNKRQHSM